MESNNQTRRFKLMQCLIFIFKKLTRLDLVQKSSEHSIAQ